MSNSNPEFNVVFHESAHFFRYYMCAFFAQHLPNAHIYEWNELTPSVYIHCMIVCTNHVQSLQAHLKPYTKIVYINCEPESIRTATFAHLIIDCKRFSPTLHPSSVPFLYLPFYALSFAERLAHPSELTRLVDATEAKQILAQKTHFCAYLYSNPIAFRDQFFDAMVKQYKPADALGACRSNRARSNTTRVLYDPLITTYYEDAIKQYKPYKFVIAMENSQLNGYITEKLMNPTLANAVPIYLGAPDVLADNLFNPKAIIHVRDFKSHEDCIAYIKKVDQNDDLYLQYLQEPLFMDNQLPNCHDQGMFWALNHQCRVVTTVEFCDLYKGLFTSNMESQSDPLAFTRYQKDHVNTDMISEQLYCFCKDWTS